MSNYRVKAQPTDDELLRRMMEGDAEAFEILYDRRQPGVYRFALRMSGSAELAEDVTHDVFIELMRDGNNFDPNRGTVAGYLMGMARHRVLRRLERERRIVPLASEGEQEDGFSEKWHVRIASDPLRDYTRQEVIDLVRQAIHALPFHYREVVVLCNLQEMTYEETANILECPVGTVRSRLNRARIMLAEKLRGLQGDDPSVSTQSTRNRGIGYELP